MLSPSARWFSWHLLVLVVVQESASLAPPYYGLERPALDHLLPPLGYNYDDLEPYIDGETVQVHYQGHHATYTQRLNAALKEWRKHNKQASRISIVDILSNVTRVPKKFREAIINNGGGYMNHNLYWSILSPNRDKEDRRPAGSLARQIDRHWTSFAQFKEAFTEAAVNLFGSGYVWLCRTGIKDATDLVMITTVNQDSPLGLGLYPILVIDVWEHAYYLKYRNQRKEYISNWWHVVDWEAVARLDNWWKGIKPHDEL